MMRLARRELALLPRPVSMANGERGGVRGA
jgi:hypothetical protein